MATDSESGKYGYGLRAARTLLKQHKRAFFVMNGLFYGAVLLGMLIALVTPDLRTTLWSQTEKAVTTGPLAPVASAYGSHKFLLAVAFTFLVNLIAGSILSINIPTAIIPFSGLALMVWRGVLWGLLFAPVHHPLGWGLLPHYGTLLLEGQAYVLAGFAAWLQSRAFLKPSMFGAETHTQGYIAGLRCAIAMYPAITVTLFCAAVYESFEGIYIVPLLVHK